MTFNEYVIVQLLAIGMKEAGMIKNDIIQKPKTKGQKRLIDLYFKLFKNVCKEVYMIYDNKFDNLMKGIEKSKYLKEWAPILVALAYAKECALNKQIKVHPNSIDKTIEILKNEDGFKYLDKFTLNSFEIAKILYNQVNKGY